MKPEDQHTFFFSKILGKQYCPKCGLIRLSNSFTDWAVKKGCINGDDPGIINQRKKTSPMRD